MKKQQLIILINEMKKNNSRRLKVIEKILEKKESEISIKDYEVLCYEVDNIRKYNNDIQEIKGIKIIHKLKKSKIEKILEIECNIKSCFTAINVFLNNKIQVK